MCVVKQTCMSIKHAHASITDDFYSDCSLAFKLFLTAYIAKHC